MTPRPRAHRPPPRSGAIERILHVITDLGQGGAETVLWQLVCATAGTFRHEVVSLHQEGVYAGPLRERGIGVTVLGMPRGRVSPRGLKILRNTLGTYRPQLVQTYLDHANLVGAVMARFASAPPVIWGVHATDLGSLRSSWKTRIVRRINAALSYRLPLRIVMAAHSSAALYAQLGFSTAKMLVIPNGVDPERFRPDPAARARLRAEWGVGREELLLGCVARWDPLKDHETLLLALQRLMLHRRAFRCVLVGTGMEAGNTHLTRLIEQCGVGEQLILAGRRQDIPDVMNCLDLHLLSSRAECMPLAVLEAMACGTPCVVTDVGDAARIVGETGWVARARDPAALAAALAAALVERSQGDFAARADACRERVMGQYSLAGMVARYAQLWSSNAEGSA
jgi:glycosyltransferase involved in cell wall biosynthesis